MSKKDLFLNALGEWMEASMHYSFHAFIRQNRKSDLSLSQVNSLMQLYHHGSGSVHALATHLGITNAAVSQLLDPLIGAGLLTRSENPRDRRRKCLELTEKGRGFVEESMKKRHAWVSDLANVLSEAEMAQILPALRLLNQRMLAFTGMHDHPEKDGSKD